MEKFSVKKPFTVLVAVVMILILGFVAVTKMDTNLLPNVNTPYLMVVTVYPGASPERVESEVSDVLQNSLTVPGVSKITATSAENYSLLLMEFAEDTDMNSALVKVSNKLDQAKSDLPSTCLTPSIIEYSLNMNAFMTVAVSREGADQYELSEFIQNTLVPEVQRKGGVSSVSSSGLVEKLVQVQLNQDKIDGINAKLLELIDTQLAAARSQLESAEAQITAGRKEYEKQLKNFGNTVSNSVMSQMSTEVGAAVETVRAQAQALLESVNSLIAVVKEPEIQQALIEVRDGLQKVMDKFNETGMRDIDSLIDIVAELRTITDKLTTALQKLQDAYTAGLIDQEAITNTTSACRDEWYAGTVGCFPYWGGLWGETLTVRLKQNVPDAEVIALPPIEGATYLYSAPSVQVISSKLSDEQVASVYKYFIEYMHDGGEGQVLFQSGVEGVHWQQSGNNIDPLPTISKPAEAFRKAWITPWLALTPMTATDKNVEVSQEATDSLAVVSANAKNISVFPVSEQRTMITSDLTTTRENIISRVAMGQLTPEEGMAEYKAQAETLNVAQALEEMNANA